MPAAQHRILSSGDTALVVEFGDAVDRRTIVRAVLPWLGLALLSLAIVTYVPSLSLWLPQQMYPNVR